MSLGPVMLDLIGTQISAEEIELIKHPQTGGVILFTRNFESIEQIESSETVFLPVELEPLPEMTSFIATPFMPQETKPIPTTVQAA